MGSRLASVPGLKKRFSSGFPGFGLTQFNQASQCFRRWCPGLTQELAGFADALGCAPEQVLYYGMTWLTPRCSHLALLPSMTASGHPMAARNYEFNDEAEDFTVIKTRITGKYTHIGTSVLGIGRDDGINEMGLTVTVSSSGFPVGPLPEMRRPAVAGLQFWAVVRTLLENCRDVKEALSMLKDMPVAYNLHRGGCAREAGYSYYHLNRQFSAVLGESVGSYIKKRRLSHAARELVYTERRVIDIALDHGFESGEAFSRAFKAVYHTSPACYRKKRLDVIISQKPKADQHLLAHLTDSLTVRPRIVEIPDILTAGLRDRTTLRNNQIPQLWTRFLDLVPQIPGQLPHGRGFGICESCGEGNTLYTMSDDLPFSEVVSVEVSSMSVLPPPLVYKTIPGGKYAVFTHTGSLKSLPLTYQYIWGTWSLTTQEKLDGREDFELYDERFLGFYHPDSQTDIYIPVQ